MSLSIAELNKMAKDTGCKLHDDCLTCPFPYCIYDIKRGAIRKATMQRSAIIKQMAKSCSIEDIAKQFGVSVRTVQRALKEK